MYKSRKKIIIISSLSGLLLGGFVVGAYFIATSFDTKEIRNKTEALYVGATSNLSQPFNVHDKNISLSDWIFSNMPKRINVKKNITDPNKKNYTIEFIDHTYNAAKNNPGNMICSINFNLANNFFDYTISTATNLGIDIKPLHLGGLSFDIVGNNLNYNVSNYELNSSSLLLQKNTTNVIPDYETFSSNLLDNSFSLERLSYIGNSPTTADKGIFNYVVKNSNNIDIYSNILLQVAQNSFQLIFSNPITATRLTSSIQIDTTPPLNTPQDVSYYNLNYTGVINGITSTIIDYPSYTSFWNINESNSINMPNIFGSIGLLDWISKL